MRRLLSSPSVTDQPDDRSSLAVAAVWASHVMTIALEMALPALAGHWVDRWLGTGPLFLLLGTVFGFAAGMWHLLRLTAKIRAGPTCPKAGHDRPNSRRPNGRSEDS